MNRREKKQEYSRISRNIFMQLIFSLTGLFALLTGGFVITWYVCAHFFVWPLGSPLYRFLKALQYLSPFLIIVTMLTGILVFTYRAIRMPLNYLNEVVEAAVSLSHPKKDSIELSPELAIVQNELNLAREQSLRNAYAAREAEQRKNDLIVYLAHDLKTPLTSVIGYLTLLRDEPDLSPAFRARYTGVALDKAERLEELINEFFDITRFNLTHLELEKQPVDLARMLQQVASEFEPQFAEKGLTCALDLPPALEYGCDPDKLARVFDNLLRNACCYSTEGTQVKIAAAVDQDAIILTFANSGITIPEEKLERIFEQFFRLDASRATRTGGAGLGLAIAKEIVELHGGAISAQSAEGVTTFTVVLPKA